MDGTNDRIARWTASLLDLGVGNALLDARGAVAIDDVDAAALATALAGRASFRIDRTRATDLETGHLHLAGAVPAGDELFVALGELVWCGDDAIEHAAPLAILPVAVRADELVATGALMPNGVLAEMLRRDFDIVLAEDASVLELTESARGLALMRPTWSVRTGARLGAFVPSTFAIWRDQMAIPDLATRGVLPRLAGGTQRSLPLPPADEVHRVVAPLDADASQLAAIAAAGAGASFVLEGPPGTGKSQTIANLIVHCATAGKTVLVVADDAPAREAIATRLAAVGLPELAVALDGDPVGQLASVLERAFRPTGATGLDPEARLADLRGTLDRYVTALHAGGRFGRPLHEAIARLVELRTTPNAALAEADATGLDRAGFERRKRAVAALATAAVPVEPVATHPWRASTAVVAPARDAAATSLREAKHASEELASATRELLALLPGIRAATPTQLAALGALAAIAATSPRPGAELLTQLRAPRGEDLHERIALIRARGTGAVEVPRDPAAFLAVAARHAQLAREVDDRFTEAVSDLDAPRLWKQLKKWTDSVAPLRFVALRSARTEVHAAALHGELHSDEAMIDALGAVIAERACREALAAAVEPARRWFGELGPDPLALDLGRVDAAVSWAAELRRTFDALETSDNAGAWRALVAQVASPLKDGEQDLALFARVADAVERWTQARITASAITGIPEAGLGPTTDAYPDHLANLAEQAAYLEQTVDALPDWVAFHAARSEAQASGVGPAIAAIERGDLAATELAGAWERATLLAWGDAELAESTELSGFHGAAHHATVAAFADLDRAVVALARTRALGKIAERVPNKRAGDPTGELAALAAARTGGATTRATLAAIPLLLPKLAPCLVGSLAAIARDLDPALPPFDVVVFDEASRIPIAQALGAIARAGSLVVVGDSRQLAPAGGRESVLDVARAAGFPQLRLATHYRSKHEDLFALANRRHYGDRLVVYPTATGSPELGVAYRCADASSEVDAVVMEVRGRLRDPAQRTRSIMVVTFGAERRALLAAALGDLEVLVVDVAHAQGQEADVVVVAVGADDVALLVQPGGDRLTNVAFTRAREQLVIVSSIEQLEDSSNAPGVHDLAAMLAFARAGGGAARLGCADAAPASPITDAIARALAERGWTLRHQVGCGAYKLELAVVDPSDPERHVLAIETDGAAYASAPQARDRDRLRAQQLAAAGWKLHRIWTLDWWNDTEREIARAHGAIVAALAATRRRAPATEPTIRRRTTGNPFRPTGSAPVVTIPPLATAPTDRIALVGDGIEPTERMALGIPVGSPLGPTEATQRHASGAVAGAMATGPILAVNPLLADGSGPAGGDVAMELVDAASAPVKLPRGSIAIGPYCSAAIPAGRRAPDELFAPRHGAEVAKIVEQVLAAEAPMHVNVLARRVGAYFGIGRLSQRLLDQVRAIVETRARWGAEPGMVWRADQDPTTVPAVRVAGTSSAGRRGIDEVPLAELAAAALIVVERAAGIVQRDLVRDTARLLGFARVTEDVTARIALGVRLATQRELIAIAADGKASIPS